MSWYEFLLREGVKPYQAYKTNIGRVRSINFVARTNSPPLRFTPKANFDQYYLDDNNDVYRDRVAELVCLLDHESGGKVLARLTDCYDALFVDEMQDLSAYDLVLLERLLASGLQLLIVGDPRQSVYSTNTAARYKQYRRSAIIHWIEAREEAGQLEVEPLTICYRSNQAICDFADGLYSDLPQTTSVNAEIVDDMGIYLVDPTDVDTYRQAHSPQELRWSRSVSVDAGCVRNFGQVKGMAFDRVLIHATEPITNYLRTGAALKDEARSKLYVAVTRARHSVAVVPKRQIADSALGYWTPA